MGAETEAYQLHTASRAEAAQRVRVLKRTLVERQRQLKQWRAAVDEQKQSAGRGTSLSSAKSSQRLAVDSGKS